MHVQIKVNPTTSTFPDDGDDEELIHTSVTHRAGTLVALLAILDREGFNLRTAGGQRIELGGEFSFTVAKRDGDADHEDSARLAVELLNSEGYDARTVEVSVGLLDDVKGDLMRFLARLVEDDLLVEEINVGTPNANGKIPVQVFTVRQGTALGS